MSGWQTVTVTLADASLDTNTLISQLGLADSVVDPVSLENSVKRFAAQNIVLPTFAQLADPSTIDPSITKGVDKNAADPRNLFRVHWYNDLNGDRVEVPNHVVLMNEPLPRNAAGKFLKTALRDGVANGSLKPTSR